MKSAEDLLAQFDRMPKYLRFKQDKYVPIIYKHEWEYNYNAYWAMYARETQVGFSSRKVLFAVSGTTLTNVLYKFYTQFDECCVEKMISGSEWLGPQPREIDFCNEKRNKSVTSVTQM